MEGVGGEGGGVSGTAGTHNETCCMHRVFDFRHENYVFISPDEQDQNKINGAFLKRFVKGFFFFYIVSYACSSKLSLLVQNTL